MRLMEGGASGAAACPPPLRAVRAQIHDAESDSDMGSLMGAVVAIGHTTSRAVHPAPSAKKLARFSSGLRWPPTGHIVASRCATGTCRNHTRAAVGKSFRSRVSTSTRMKSGSRLDSLQ
eukprot:TRINITY_DN29712_c0_g1_i1.p2 TRINITY_DN29712_c0_g1~~TRINITY_DN29712_c0_g1_i1.p2  ORF type:complete len:119 (-),score=4.57 TRINITY_DN29712_c0_g1_i1:503-859(-)